MISSLDFAKYRIINQEMLLENKRYFIDGEILF